MLEEARKREVDILKTADSLTIKYKSHREKNPSMPPLKIRE